MYLEIWEEKQTTRDDALRYNGLTVGMYMVTDITGNCLYNNSENRPWQTSKKGAEHISDKLNKGIPLPYHVSFRKL